ncbi:response regulator [Aquabacterium sp. A08]|nr:Hpt domain-containing protein [Aquabacterium sp. A08]NIC42613.1 response regulator [Aquabacterium sp. A08]
MDEVRRALDEAVAGVAQFVADNAAARASDLAEVDATPLRMLRQQLHQAVGALEMVELAAPAQVLRALEALVQRLVQRPAGATPEAAQAVAQGARALAEHLDRTLRQRPLPDLALFPTLRDWLRLAGAARIHPADLWPAVDTPWPEPPPGKAYTPGPAVRAHLDRLVLLVVKQLNPAAAAPLGQLAAGLARGSAAAAERRFWLAAAAYFEAVAQAGLPDNVYVKRAASSVLLQYTHLSQGDPQGLAALTHDLCCLAAQAQVPDAAAAPCLHALAQAHGWHAADRWDWERRALGQTDPAVLARLRAGVAAAQRAWALWTEGDVQALDSASGHLATLAADLPALHPDAQPLAEAWAAVVQRGARAATGPWPPGLALEVSNSLLFLGAELDDFDALDPALAVRHRTLAQRLWAVLDGQPAPAAEAWMTALYRRLSERQTLGHVVTQLHSELAAVEAALDAVFRCARTAAPGDVLSSQAGPARDGPGWDEVPAQLEAMAGVAQMLGLDAAVAALQAVRGVVQAWGPRPDAAVLRADADRLAPNLSALGWLFDTLARQPELARDGFVFEAESQTLRSVQGPAVPAVGAPAASAGAPVAEQALAEATANALPAPPGGPAADTVPVAEPPAEVATVPAQGEAAPEDDDGAELLAIFTDEAREVFVQARAGLDALRERPASLPDLTAVRRAFHTLKGSARMVGLAQVGEAAWALEQLLNAWLADQRPASPELLALCEQALVRLAGWVEALAQGRPEAEAGDPAPLRASADALRLRGEVLPLEVAEDEGATVLPVGEAAEDERALPSDAAGAPTDGVLEETVKPEPAAPPVLEEAVKVIGPLCIDLELYNVFLNEADEWSRRLSHGLSEWALTPGEALPPELSALAHSLAGGAGTVGYTGLSRLARALEHALDRCLALPSGLVLASPDVAVLVTAADEARHLLHQFAAGFLKEPSEDTLVSLSGVAAVAVAPALGAELDVPETDRVPGQAPSPQQAQKQEQEQEQEHFADAAAQESVPSDEPGAPLPTQAPTSAVAAPDAPPTDRPETASPPPSAVTPSRPAAAPWPAAIDRLDPDLFAVFEDEAQELLPRLGAALRQWVARPDNASARAEVLRNLHTFKGSARLAGALRLGDLAHRLEADVLALPEVPGAPEQVRPLLPALDALVARFDGLRAAFAPAPAGQSAPVVDGVQLLPPEGLPQPAAPLRPEAPAGPGVTVRVRADLLDQLMTQTGDVMLTRGRLETDMRALRQSFKDMSGNIERLRSQLRDLELQTETQMQSRLAQNRDTDPRFDPLEFDRYTRVQELTRLLAESVNDVATVQHHLQRAVEGAEGNLAAQARQTRELQRDLLRTRLVAFDSLAERLHRVLRQAADASGKQAELQLHGAEVEVDRGVLERLAPVLEHLLRNAVAHGIETPAERRAAGKPEAGQVTLALHPSGNDLALELVDDGAGLNLPRLHERAVALGLVPSAAPFTEAEAVRCMFAPGVSTATEVTETAGRGIGLDVVRTEVLGLGGRIEYLPPAGAGTGFRLVVPLSTAVTQVVMLRVGDFTFGVPAPWVEAVRRAHAPELTAAYVSGQWREGPTLMPFFWAGALLALSTESTDPQAHAARSWPVLEFYSAGQRVAWHVDEVLGHQEVVVKPLGPQLARLPGLAGATVLASGAVALIYNPVALASLYGDAARAWVRSQRAQGIQGAVPVAPALPHTAPGAAGQAPLVLVVDDSITVRRVTQRLLKREGYRVALASDGLQALERLREEAPVVVLCDIEMPRMDGFEFVRHLRDEPQWADLPVVMITSRLADKHRDHAQAMGVDHYLGKPYSEEELLALVAAYARLAPQPEPPRV